MPFKVCFHHMQEITILRYRGHKVIDVDPERYRGLTLTRMKLSELLHSASNGL